jgi:polygalacturonase
MNSRAGSLCFALVAIVTCALLAGGAAGAAKDEIAVNPKLPEIPDRTFNLNDFGAVGDGKSWNTEAFKAAIAKIDEVGGGRLVVPAGVYRTRPFTLCSKLDLHLEEGAVIQAPDSFADYDLPAPETLASQEEVRARVRAPKPLVSGRDLHDVAITGSGAIDGAGAIWWAWTERATRTQPGRIVYPRTNLVVIDGCHRLHVEGVTFRNSPRFHFVPTDTTDLLVERVTVVSPADAQNTDGIDPTGCTNVLIRDCKLDVGDDNIVIKQAGSNILIEDCQCKHGHGISIGSGTAGGVRQMLVRRCTFDHTDNGIRIKSMRGAGGLVEDITYTDIEMNGVVNAIVLDLTYMDSARPNFRGDAAKIPQIKNVTIAKVKARGSRNAGRIIGLPESPITNVIFRDVEIGAKNDFVVRDADEATVEQIKGIKVQLEESAGARKPAKSDVKE